MDKQSFDGFFRGYALLTKSPGGAEWFAETDGIMAARVRERIEELRKDSELGDPREIWRYFDVNAANHHIPDEVLANLTDSAKE